VSGNPDESLLTQKASRHPDRKIRLAEVNTCSAGYKRQINPVIDYETSLT
jgi:hypothetical protein